ncbi:hypothetical protein K402DRAFT_268272 [Aulographum hederae CBS 113979]|uniref:Uncharacterized protein n=1 Tax=Aulographum hederae CBS 113979 TaxID=1176131 RepID=A0A6G1H876_9PEZI|nr:hypothetical protein K402DRAFT_268272 [Aulographum hederae CBS 113979]
MHFSQPSGPASVSTAPSERGQCLETAEECWRVLCSMLDSLYHQVHAVRPNACLAAQRSSFCLCDPFQVRTGSGKGRRRGRIILFALDSSLSVRACTFARCMSSGSGVLLLSLPIPSSAVGAWKEGDGELEVRKVVGIGKGVCRRRRVAKGARSRVFEMLFLSPHLADSTALRGSKHSRRGLPVKHNLGSHGVVNRAPHPRLLGEIAYGNRRKGS